MYRRKGSFIKINNFTKANKKDDKGCLRILFAKVFNK